MLAFGGMLLGLFAFLAGFGAFSFIPPGVSLPFKLKAIKPRQSAAVALGVLIVIVLRGCCPRWYRAPEYFPSHR